MAKIGKIKTTQKYIKGIEDNIIRIGYCDLWHLLQFTDPNYYTCGVYGWNADIYLFNDCTIVTGYRPFGNISPSHEMCRDYEEKARVISSDWGMSYEEKKDKIQALLDEFLDVVLERCR